MSDFDPLLKQVLREEANVEPPVGMKGRLGSAIAQESNGRRGMGAFWRVVAAAAMLIAFIGSQAFRHGSTIAAPSTEGVARASLLLGEATVSEADFAKVPSAQPVRPTHISRHRVRRAVNTLAPIQLEPLVVQPIEIASLTLNNPASKGEKR